MIEVVAEHIRSSTFGRASDLKKLPLATVNAEVDQLTDLLLIIVSAALAQQFRIGPVFGALSVYGCVVPYRLVALGMSIRDHLCPHALLGCRLLFCRRCY